MKRVFKVSLCAAAGLGLMFAAAPSQAGPAGVADFVTTKLESAAEGQPLLQRVAGQSASQTANMPVGKIRLRMIREVGGKAMREPIHWRVMTYGRDENGRRQQVAEVTESTPILVLPAGWYIVHARTSGKTIKHPVEVTAGKTFKYTLVNQ